MGATDVIVLLLCIVLIVAGIAAIRLSRRQRGPGAIAVVLGVIGLLAWTAVEQESSPPPNATPTHGLVVTVTPTADAP
jgi:hypothetical protein